MSAIGQHTTEADALELYEKKIKNVDKKTGNVTYNYYSVDAGLQKMKHERFAFHVDQDSVLRTIIDTFNERDICDLQTIMLLPKQEMGSVTQKKSAFRKVLNYGIHRLQETGVLARERSTWRAKAPTCTRSIHSEDLQVELIPLASLFLTLLGGFLVSVIILAFEIMLHKSKEYGIM